MNEIIKKESLSQWKKKKNLVYEREWVGSWTRSRFLTCTRFVGRVDENWVFLVADLHKICSSFVREVCLLHEIRSALGRENWVSSSCSAGDSFVMQTRSGGGVGGVLTPVMERDSFVMRTRSGALSS